MDIIYSKCYNGVIMVGGFADGRSWRRAIWCSWTSIRCLCFRISFVGNNPSLQIHSFSEDWGKCNKTGNPSISDFSTILTSDIQILADSSHLPSNEAYRQRMSLPCYRLSTPCYECKPNARHFFDEFSLKRGSAGGKCVYSVTWHLLAD